MDIDEARSLVLSSFDDETYCYSHVIPFRHSNFIDGMAWVGVLCGAAHKIGDVSIAQKAENYLYRLMEVGPDARNFAPVQVDDDWMPSETIPGYWYTQKPQAFAGPAGLQFAIDCGARLHNPYSISWKARLMVLFGWLFGYVSRGGISWLSVFVRQYTNSMFMAHLITRSKVPTSMLWLCEDTALFQYIAGIKSFTEYPDPSRTTGGHTEEVDQVVPMKDRKPSAWVFRNWLKTRYIRDGVPVDEKYTPIWQVVGDYLQSTIKE